ncbi:MAG: ATP-binding protein [Jatrophihabitantaceae bacterium]
MTARTGGHHLSALGANRYSIFLTVVGVSALSPALPHDITPDPTWWVAGAGTLCVMVLAGWLGHFRPREHWLNTVAPLLLLPAVHALRCADGNWRSGFAPLIFLPVVWFALYGRLRDVWLAIVGGAGAIFLPMYFIGEPQYPDMSWRGSLLLVVISAAIGPLIYALVRTTMLTNRALRRSETEFRAAFEDAPVGMAVTGLHGDVAHQFVRVNRALCELFGRSARELTSMKIAELTHPDDLARSGRLSETVTEPDAPHRVEKRYLHKSGRTIWASVSYSVVNDEHGKPSHLVSQIEDLGARRESDQALLDAFETDREANERLRQVERIRTDLASTVSHELRTPLTSAAGYVELLVEGDAGPLTVEQRDMLDTVARSLTRLDGIVDDVLGMAMPGQQSSLDIGSADLGAVLQSAIASVTLQAATRGQDLRVTNDLDGATVAGNSGRLERAVVNLLTNALKFTPVDGTVTVTGRRGGGDATIEVTDTGIGIAAEDQPRIFERFYRAGTATDSTVSGAGLGLAIAQTITTQYGGRLTVDSEPDSGSTFTLTLPLRSTV